MNNVRMSAQSLERIARLRAASPLYSAEIDRRPGTAAWLEDARNLAEPFRFSAFLETWGQMAPLGTEGGAEARLAALRRWRRLMSLRIAHRSVNSLCTEAETVEELTVLAEFCIRECMLMALRKWTDLLGQPWDRALGRPARFCVLALGKLGGRELNFSSDIDLLYMHEGDGTCSAGGVPSTTTNEAFFTRVAETMTRWLGDRTGDGFLFRTDVRLRPEGAVGPLVPSTQALEHYYAASGQTWERLALLKARPVAGDIELGAELLESLHSFRYPRRPPPSLIEDVAAMKARSDAELAARDSLGRNVKLGTGGIREIEFIAQALQLLNAGRFPFLQTGSTGQALALLSRYGIMDPGESAQLAEAYWFLRRVEHRLQIRDEEQTHSIPSEPRDVGLLAASLGMASAAAFEEALTAHRSRVHQVYTELFAQRGLDDGLEAWWDLLTTDRVPARLEGDIRRWLGSGPDAPEALRLLATGGRQRPVTRELAVRFQHVARAFETFHAELARPLSALRRLSRFAERYSSRAQFLGFCAENPSLFRMLSVLFDRSESASDLLCAHPEIVDEVLRPQVLRRPADARTLLDDVIAGERSPEFGSWLWIYARAEQVRHALGFLGSGVGTLETEARMTRLAEAVLGALTRDSGILVVALGKFGSGELSFGSDIDLMFVAEDGSETEAGQAAERVLGTLRGDGPLGPALELDMRLRPHGPSGPLATSVAALEAYHRGAGGQLWEKQALVRARVVSGPRPLAADFEAWRTALLYGRPAARSELRDIRAMRLRIERELGKGAPGCAFKAGKGGLNDVSFCVQSLQLLHGHSLAAARVQGTRQALAALAKAGCLQEQQAEVLRGNYEFLRRLETSLRLDSNRGVVRLPDGEEGCAVLARWLGFRTTEEFFTEHLKRMAETRDTYENLASALELSATA